MKSIHFIWILLLLAACSTVQETQEVKIGVIAPLSGGAAFIGDGVVNAIQLAQEDLGDTDIQYTILFEDDKLDPKTTATVANKLIHVDDVDALISISSGSGNVVAPIAEQNEVIHFAIASDISIARRPYNYVHWTPPAAEAELWVQEAKNRGVKTMAATILYQQGAIAIMNEIKARLPDAGIELVHEEFFDAGELDFKTIILKATRTNPDIYFIGAFSPEIEILGKQIQELGVDVPLSTIEAFEFSQQPKLFENQWYVNAADPTPEFVAKYQARYDSVPPLGAANAYDAYSIIVTAHAEEEALIQIVDHPGALGSLTMGPDRIIQTVPVIRTIQGGMPVTIPPLQK